MYRRFARGAYVTLVAAPWQPPPPPRRKRLPIRPADPAMVPFRPAAGTDLVSARSSPRCTRLGQQIVIDNRGGAQ